LKTFARKETRIEMQADLGLVLTNALDLVDHKLRAFGIDVQYSRHRGQLIVTGNPIHLEQVFINLIANAADAMEHVSIRVLSIGIARHERSVEVAVSDSGSGIAEGELANLFDPFYSTKEAGRGLGLGLSISYGLVRDIGGAITVTSTAGKGSTFTVRLPLSAVTEPSPPRPSGERVATPGAQRPGRAGVRGEGPTDMAPRPPARGRGKKDPQ
jgi:C4-dicarboxylate-specific signal transduction histidine kinase